MHFIISFHPFCVNFCEGITSVWDSSFYNVETALFPTIVEDKSLFRHCFLYSFCQRSAHCICLAVSGLFGHREILVSFPFHHSVIIISFALTLKVKQCQPSNSVLLLHFRVFASVFKLLSRLYIMNVPRICRGQRRVSHPGVTDGHKPPLGAEKQSQVLCKSSKCC